MKSKLKTLLTDDDAVSPVIGVILMVAITVILAAVIGTFVLGLGDQVGQSAPTASLSIQDAPNDYNASTASGSQGPAQNAFVINHNNGDTLNEEDLRITVRNADDNSLVADFDPASKNITDGNGHIDLNLTVNGNSLRPEDDITLGDSVAIFDNSSGPTAGSGQAEPNFEDNTDYVITVIHVPSESQLAQSTVELQ